MRRDGRQAVNCLAKELAWRRLAISAELRAELEAIAAYPDTAIAVCMARLDKGEQIIKRRGGNDAPDSLWTRFEALLATWICCDQARQAERERIRRRLQRESVKRYEEMAREAELRNTINERNT